MSVPKLTQIIRFHHVNPGGLPVVREIRRENRPKIGRTMISRHAVIKSNGVAYTTTTTIAMEITSSYRCQFYKTVRKIHGLPLFAEYTCTGRPV
jgi:hypothetical protein